MDKSGTGVLVRDGLGKDANEWFKMEPKKRQGWRSGTLGARTPDHLRVEFDDSATIASCPTSVPMGLAASEIVSASHRPSDAARARLGANWRG